VSEVQTSAAGETLPTEAPASHAGGSPQLKGGKLVRYARLSDLVLRRAAERVLNGERDLLIAELTAALERVYGDSPTGPIADLLLPAYRSRCQTLGGFSPSHGG
jgi:hypothetical protein